MGNCNLSLCQFSNDFPHQISQIFERDKHLKRNFREETATDLLMAGLSTFRASGILVDFPHEPTTGGDMEWTFVAPNERNGGRYLSLMIQAKRARFSKTKNSGYWYYAHLAHGTPPGQQARNLVSYASSAQSPPGTYPMYIFYHPLSALSGHTKNLPPIRGVNLTSAYVILPVVSRRCTRPEMRVTYWRPHFISLPDLFCPAIHPISPVGPNNPGMPSDGHDMPEYLHPDSVAERLERHRNKTAGFVRALGSKNPPKITAVTGIPKVILRALNNETTVEDRKGLKRPRAIFRVDSKQKTAD